VGKGTGREQKWGHRFGTKHRKKILGGRAPHFLALKAQLVILVSAFVMVSTVWSDNCLLFFYSRCSLYPAICKSGGHVPTVPNGVGATEGLAQISSHPEEIYDSKTCLSTREIFLFLQQSIGFLQRLLVVTAVQAICSTSVKRSYISCSEFNISMFRLFFTQ